ncbi:uncharacterized protein E0L32_008411 [Thyridium curvatum]|uniref:C2H2-type domain-containing protein n=1 Tax=Thyridium curvatum TaxID=1093900 RepID=A0A507AT89_9PEZI|nr:uncharacterized protein E0L32_008411 [Thyridium curvatum]TPX10677.1 hypothetical protein E0L32_008411 [Thyridium curvatum]
MSTSSSQCDSSPDSHGSPAMARHAALPRSLEATEPEARDDAAQDPVLAALSDLRISTGPSPRLTTPRDTSSIAAMGSNALSARSSTIARRQLSGGGIAGAVVGSVIGAALILLCVSPFLLRRSRNARARREQAELQAEMGLAAETAPGRGDSLVASPATDRRLSVDHFGHASSDDTRRPVKDYDMDGNSYDNMTPSGTGVPQYANAFTAAPQGGEGDAHPPFTGPVAPAPLAMPPPAAPLAASPDQAQPPRKSSLSNAIEGFAEKATALFHRSSTRSSSRSAHITSPTRSTTMQADPNDVPMPTFSEEQTYSPVMMTGAAAEYFSGAPLSPPSSDYSPPPQAPYGSTDAGATPLNFMSMPRAAILAKFEAPSRQGSQADDFSPMSPTSPGRIKGEPEDEEEGVRGFSASPMRMRIPSPSHPEPGTVNPMDVWAPANASERGHQVAAELDKMQESPPPQAASPPMQVYHSVVEEQQQQQQQQQPYYEPQLVQEHTQPSLPHQDQQYYHQPTIVEPEPENRAGEFVAHEMPETDASTPPPGSQSSLPSTYTTPDTRLTEPTPGYMNTPSPRSNEGSTPAHSSDISGASPRTFTCEECGRIFDQVHKLNHHKRYHERPHECTHQGCGKRFGTKTHLDRHINDKHKKTRKYHCTIADCAYSRQGGKSFPRKDNWRRHMQNKHNLNPEHDPVEVVDETMTGT